MGRRWWRAGVLALRAAAATTVAVRLARAARPAPRIDLGATADRSLSITAIVPARNEATRIVPCLVALTADPSVHEVLVVDDESNDGTADIAAAHGAFVVKGGALPAGWTGKAWAMQRGLEEATGEWVMFVDADTEPAAGLAAALVQRARDDGLTLATAMGRVACRTNAEQVVHASMLTTFVYRFGPIDGRPARRTSRVLANGQCLVGRRADLLAAGIDSIGMRAGEDVALARLVTARGGTVARLDAASHLRVRGYAGGRWTWAGWGRSFALGDLTTPGWLAADLLVVWFAQVLPLLRLLVRRGDPLDVVALALRVGTLVGTRRAYDEPGLAYWLSPLADGPVAYLFTKTAWRPPRTWRDRTYADRPPRLNRRRGNG